MRRIAICSVFVLLAGCGGPQFDVSVHDLRKPPATVRARVKGGVLRVNVFSPSGIGSARLALRSGQWPRKFVVWLRYAEGRPFKRLEDFALEIEPPGGPRRLAPGRRVRVSDDDGTPGIEGDLPVGDEPSVLHLRWIDAFRR